MKAVTGRDAMRSPGAPSLRRDVERRFWAQIATGITSEKAAEAVAATAEPEVIGRKAAEEGEKAEAGE